MEDKKVKPLSPDEVVNAKQYQIPDEVISAFNTLITKNFYGQSAYFKQDDVIDEIINNLKSMGKYTDTIKETIRGIIFDSHWLDVEDIFKEVGWIVKHDQPDIGESYDTLFTFKRKTK